MRKVAHRLACGLLAGGFILALLMAGGVDGGLATETLVTMFWVFLGLILAGGILEAYSVINKEAEHV